MSILALTPRHSADRQDKMIVRLAAGIARKFAVTMLDRGQINLGRYAEILGDIALRGAPIPPTVDVDLTRPITVRTPIAGQVGSFFRAAGVALPPNVQDAVAG